MAFSGLHVLCAYSGGDSASDPTKQALLTRFAWSENPSSGTATNNKAPENTDHPIFSITVSADSYVSIGRTPDATTSPRILIMAGTSRDVYVQPNDKLAWIAA